MKVDKMISEDEAALYDRQIRLWGVDAQKKLLSSRVLLINIQGLGAEIAKNLVLSGINSITILDSNTVTDEDLKFNFLIPHSTVGNNRAESCVDALQTLNPMVKVFADKDSLEQKESEYFSDKNFDLVCMLSSNLQEMQRVNNLCRSNNVLFLAGFVFGLYGFMFVDFNNYQFIVEAPKISEDNCDKNKQNSGTTCAPSQKTEEKLTLIERNISFKSFESFLNEYPNIIQNLSANKIKRLSKTYLVFLLFRAFMEEYKRPFLPNSQEDKENLLNLKKSVFEQLKLDQDILSDSYLADKTFQEFSPVNAILGGVVAQEVIKAISKKNEPIENFFVFDGNVMSGEVIKI